MESRAQPQIFGGEHHTGRAARPVWDAMLSGFRCKCPSCGKGKLFSGFLTVVPACSQCGEVMHHHRADDLPAYLVLVIVGHVIVGAFMAFEANSTLSTWQHLAIWVPITIAMSLALLQPVKGAVVGLQWALYMHGFGEAGDTIETHPEL